MPHAGDADHDQVRHLDLHVRDSALQLQLEVWDEGVDTRVAPRRSKYFIFALYLPLFQLILDVFILNTQELVFGWKVYDYVSYQRYRFSVRDQRCVSRRPVVLWCFHFLGWTRGHLTSMRVVFFRF